MVRGATRAAEKAKIELSTRDGATIYLQESEAQTKDESDEPIEVDLAVTRPVFNSLIEEKIMESIAAAREILERAHLAPRDIQRVVFVGGPTQYEYLRTRVCQELGISGSTDVDPMTAVAEGASLFAESIDWTTATRKRKNARGAISTRGSLNVTFSSGPHTGS